MPLLRRKERQLLQSSRIFDDISLTMPGGVLSRRVLDDISQSLHPGLERLRFHHQVPVIQLSSGESQNPREQALEM